MCANKIIHLKGQKNVPTQNICNIHFFLEIIKIFHNQGENITRYVSV